MLLAIADLSADSEPRRNLDSVRQEPLSEEGRYGCSVAINDHKIGKRLLDERVLVYDDCSPFPMSYLISSYQ